ncbi:MAG: type II toxin-antitoxin system death-on-curing family toxin [Kiloniellales bacterium]
MALKWLTQEMVLNLHKENMAEFGGDPSLRDRGLLESALERPRNLHAYGDAPSIHALAAAHCSGIVRNHPFVDGNKRAGIEAANAFLALNGLALQPSETEIVHVILALAASELDDDALADWIAENTAPVDDDTDGKPRK